MSLLQKASIVTTPTAYGVGVLNSIKPAYALGEELVTNGDFATDSNWTKGTGWTISGGKANIDGSQTGTSNLFQNMGILSNKSVKVEYTVSNYSAGHLDLSFFGTGLPASETRANANGNYIWYVNIPTGHNGNVGFSANSSFVGSVDNFSVKVETEADFDFTRNSSATRVNPDYLIQDVSILSSNLVQNGNFSELGSELIPSITTITNAGGGTITEISGNTYSSTSDGTSGSSIRPKIDFATTSGKTYKLIITPIGTVTGTINFKFYDGSSYIFQNYDFSTIKEIYFTDNGNVFGSFDGTETYNINSFIISVKQVDPNDNWTISSGAAIGLNKLNINADAFNFFAEQTVLTNGLNYKVTLDAIVTSGDILIYTGTQFATINSSGTYTFSFISNSTKIRFRSSGSALIGSITNISVIEVQQTDIPRLDYTNGTASILLEGQSTNLITYSQDFSNSYWTKSGASVTSGFVSPDGTNNAYKLVEDSANSRHFINSAEFLTPGTVYSSSVFVKPNGRNKIAFRENAQTGNYAAFNLSNGTLIGTNGVSASIESMSNGWYRINYQITSGASIVLGFELLSDSYTSGDPFSNPYQGNGTSGIYIYGAQVEQQSYATSYIPTSGSTVTRVVEVLNNAGNSDLINSTEGVLYAEIAALANDGTNRAICISKDGTLDNIIVIQYNSVSQNIRFLYRQGAVSVADLSFALNDITQFHKVAGYWKQNEFKLFMDGAKVGEQLSGNVSANDVFKTLNFNRPDGQNFYGKCKSVAVFKEALSDTELACLTSTNNREIFLNYYYRMQYVGANTEALSCAEQTFNV